jgi:hypothetical protein
VLSALRPSGLTLGQRWLSVKHDVYEKVEDVKTRIQCAHAPHEMCTTFLPSHACVSGE